MEQVKKQYIYALNSIINRFLMGFAQCCKECSCWCLFAVSSIMMMLMVFLALNDMEVISGRQALLQHTINTSIPQLNCVEICKSWYSQENNNLCCDRYNMDLCVEKEQCRKDYITNSEIEVQILSDNKFSQMIVALICALILIMVLCRNRKKKTQAKVQQQVPQDKLMDMMKKVIEDTQKQNQQKKEMQVNDYSLQRVLNKKTSKLSEFSTIQNNPNQTYNLMNETINCPLLNQQMRNHVCEHCSRFSNK